MGFWVYLLFPRASGAEPKAFTLSDLLTEALFFADLDFVEALGVFPLLFAEDWGAFSLGSEYLERLE